MWSEFSIQYLFFNLKLLSIVIAIVTVFVLLLALIAKAKRGSSSGMLEIKALDEDFKDLKEDMLASILDEKDYKKYVNATRKAEKAQEKSDVEKSSVYVLSFEGDIEASQVDALREEVTAVLTVAQKDDLVIVKIDSPGGVVNSYGLAASQLARIRDRGIKLVAVVDEVAASGGYMMASVANEIICAPFAIVGSIGVVGQVPNIHHLLKKNGVEVELHTAGQYKRTLTTLGENTDEGREKFKQDLEAIQTLFKKHICTYRPQLDIEAVATGEYWFGSDALALNLVDKLQTSDDYLMPLFEDEAKQVFSVTYKIKKSRFAQTVSKAQKLLMRQAL